MKFYYLILTILVLSTYGCSPSLLFTNEQFVGYFSDASIPEKWHGQWINEFNEDDQEYYITKDSIYLNGFEYKIIKSNMHFSPDDDNPSSGADKIIFKDDWCFLADYNTQVDSLHDFSGYQVLIANFDKEGNINCWEMSYDYFLKHRLVNRIPTLKFVSTNVGNGEFQKIETKLVYADLPKQLSNHEYKQLIRNTTLCTSNCPFYCDNSYDFDFFKKIASSRTPDLILTASKKVVLRNKNKNERKYDKIADRNWKKKYMKIVTE